MAFSFFSLSLLSFSLVVSFTSLPKYLSSYKKSSFFLSTLVGFTYLSTNTLVSFKLSFSKRKENSSSKAEEIFWVLWLILLPASAQKKQKKYLVFPKNIR